MSVVIRKREEKRNTPFYTFLGAAAVPLLLMLIGGLVLGRGGAEDASYWKDKYELALAQKDSLIRVQTGTTQLINILDSLRLDLDKDVNNLEGKLYQAYPQQISSWEREKGSTIGRYSDLAGELQSKYSISIGSSDLVRKQIDLFDEYAQKQKEWLEQNRLILTSKEEAGQDAVLKAELEQEKEENAELKAEVNKLELKIIQIQIDCAKSQGNDEAAGLGRELEEAKTKLVNAQAAAASIRTHLNTIRNTILPNIDANFINFNKDRMQQVRTQLSEEVNAADVLCGQISQ